MKKNNPNNNQQPKDPQGQRFIAWFPHRWNFIEADEFDTNHPQLSRRTRRQAWVAEQKAAKSKGKSQPNWRTVTEYAIEPVVLWHRWKDPNDLVGVSFDSKTLYAVSDIDRGSPIHPYNNERAFREWLSSFEEIGLNNYVIIRSSFSEGLHIYFPLPQQIGTFNLACALQICSEKASVKVKSGELEIFPNTKNFCRYKPTAYKAHRMPLQPHTGSTILDNNLNPIGEETEVFCDQMEWAAARQDMKALEIACNVAREIINFRRMGSNSKTQLAKLKRDLEIMIAEGWTDEGQTNFILGKIAAYGMIFTEHEGEELANYIAQTARSCDGYTEYCNHKHEIERRARDYAKSAERYYWKPGTPRKRAGTYHSNFCNFTNTNPNYNTEKAQTAQERIIEGLNNLLIEGINLTVKGIVAFRDALRAEIYQLHQKWVSISTLMKYRSLWHPKDKGIVLGTEPATSKNEPENENEIEIEEKTPEANPDQNHPKSTPVETAKHSEIKGCTHLERQTAQTETPKHSEIKGCTHLPLYEGLYDPDAPQNPSSDRDADLETATEGFSLNQSSVAQHSAIAKKAEEEKKSTSEPKNSSTKQETPTLNNNNSSVLISNSDTLQSASDGKNCNKQSLCNETYYRELLERHPELKALELEMRSPQYQQKRQEAFARIRESLERARRGKQQL